MVLLMLARWVFANRYQARSGLDVGIPIVTGISISEHNDWSCMTLAGEKGRGVGIVSDGHGWGGGAFDFDLASECGPWTAFGWYVSAA